MARSLAFISCRFFEDMLRLLPWMFVVLFAGVLSQFSPPSGDICPGSDIEFSCVGNSLSVSSTRWGITPGGGGDRVCTVAHNVPGEMDSCGPGDIFTSSLDVDAEVNYTSSLRAEDVPLTLNGTVVECVDGADTRIIGSSNICIVGKQQAFPCLYILRYCQGPCVSSDFEWLAPVGEAWSDTKHSSLHVHMRIGLRVTVSERCTALLLIFAAHY